ncbi:MAG: hypothetical protein IPK98_12815 [Chloracidobacterium sp.]|nr:hypothetical protein [Chloracidobacterium sp.]
MLQNILISVLIFLFSGVFALVFGQTPGAATKPTYVRGEVAAIESKSISVTTDTGKVDAAITEKTAFKRVSAETLDFAKGVDGALADIAVGDKVTVSALAGSDGKSLNARTIYFITKADIAAKNAKEAAEWQKRGIAGKVTTVSPQGQITVDVRNLTGSTALVVTPKTGAKFIRYAPDSERFDEAKPSTLAEIKVGDMLRAIGDKNTEGNAMTAETILTGAFQTVAGTVVSTDVAKNEVVIKNLQTNKEVTIEVGPRTVLKNFPVEMAERMAGAQMGAAGMTGPRPVGQGGNVQVGPPNTGGQPAGQGQTPGGPVRVGMGGRGGGSVDEMLERFPAITVENLKAGDMIAVSSTNNGNVTRMRAIKLLAGVEPFLRMAQATGRRSGQGGVEGGFSIPGMDGVGFP